MSSSEERTITTAYPDGRIKTSVMSEKDHESWMKDRLAAFHVSRMREIRVERNALLAASDWTQVADAPVDAAAWAKYRQALRDLPAKIKDPTAEVAWPEPPK